MKRGVKVNPCDVPKAVFLSRQDLGDEMIPVEEPLTTENIEDLEDRGSIYPREGGVGLRRGCHREGSSLAEGRGSGGGGGATARVGRERMKTHV